LCLSYEEFCDKSDEELARLFSVNTVPVPPNPRLEALEEKLPELCKKLGKRGVTTITFHKEYLADYPDGYGITQFRGNIRRYLQLSKAVMRIEHKAGDKMYVDYAGDKLQLTLPDDICQPVEVFVAVLGCGQLTYVEAKEGQRKEDFIRSCENALHFYGGVPLALVTDDLKSAVTKASRYEAVLNEDFAAFGEHYGIALCPARGYKPKDKALVENAVKLTYRHIYTRLEGRKYSDLHSLNLALRSAFEIYNNKQFPSKSYSRRDHFEDVEKDVLRPLNPIRFEVRTHLQVTVNRYGHVRLKEDNHSYSVPHIHIGKKVNSHGYIVRTSGIDTTRFAKNPVMFYMHEREGGIIGRWDNIRIEGTQLLADAVFDENNPIGRRVMERVEGGFLRSASIGIENAVIEYLNGIQVIVKCELKETSIVDIPANCNAVKLYKKDGKCTYNLADLDEPDTDDLRAHTAI
jgi:transposase